MSTIVRRLNRAGLEEFERYLDMLTGMQHALPPKAILEAAETSESLGVMIEIEHRGFESRHELGMYLKAKLEGSGLSGVARDRGLWAWLSLFYFEVLCPPSSSGHRKPGKRARWILDADNFQRYYRHLLAGPYSIASAFADAPEVAMCLLCGTPDRPGELVEQIASRQEMVTNRAVVGAATKLYYDSVSRKLKRGAGGKDRGSPRRFAEVLQQFDVTYDLYTLNADQVVELLPDEFNRFREP